MRSRSLPLALLLGLLVGCGFMGRPSAFKISYQEAQSSLVSEDFILGPKEDCYLGDDIDWAECAMYIARNGPEGPVQFVEVMHEENVVVGVLTFYFAGSGSLGLSKEELAANLKISNTNMEPYMRQGDFYYFEFVADDTPFYGWYDFRVAELILPDLQ